MVRLICAIVTVLGLMGAATTARSGNFLRFHSDPAGSTCFLNYTDLGVATVHVFLTGTTPSSAVQFTALVPACWSGATWLGDVVSPPFLTIGDSQEPVFGISVALGGCKDMPMYIGSVNFLVSDLSAECCEFAPGPADIVQPGGAPPLRIVATVDCTNPFPDWVIREAQPVGLVVNSNPSCPCELPLSVTESTWGQIKALYR